MALPSIADRRIVLRPHQSLRLGRSPDNTKSGSGARPTGRNLEIFAAAQHPEPLSLKLSSPAVSRNHLIIHHEGYQYIGAGAMGGHEANIIAFEDMGSSYGTVIQDGHGEHPLERRQIFRQAVATNTELQLTLLLSPSNSAAVVAVQREENGFGLVIDIVQDGFSFEPEPFDIWLWRVLARLRATAARQPMTPSIIVTEATTIIPGLHHDICPYGENEPHWRVSFEGGARILSLAFKQAANAEYAELTRELDELRRIAHEETEAREKVTHHDNP